jgi:hypothetical protein
VRERLHDAGINFEELYASSFAVKSGTKTTTFRPKKTTVELTTFYISHPNIFDLLQSSAEQAGLNNGYLEALTRFADKDLHEN